ncbi:tail fiber domain-containing protein [Flavobacterium sp. ACN6]|uniref:tail fiber domain-containing protein n=1 Tax=Flavobacterium sp. ACN6 TaxID=1920426 RepID=UPI0015565CD6|nr:tail fiber domain-containing protein [Flavobacterium sp. ACN6]PBJ11872.1 hypothetical protein BSF42_26040 [Flavobacterium sp. ACN6]
MKKITCWLLLIQSAFMMAQTETVVTPNGKKVVVYPAAPGTADNGLTLNNNHIQLGGALVQPSVLTTTDAFTLAIKGLKLSEGYADINDNYIVTVDSYTGVLRARQNNGWDTSGNANIDPSLHFLGTMDNADLVFKRNNIMSGLLGINNTSFGFGALNNTTTGINNIALGTGTLSKNTTANSNIGIGDQSLYSTTSGDQNIGIGYQALYNNFNGDSNIGIGYQALYNNTGGRTNVAIGDYAMLKATIGNTNVAIGRESLYNLTSGHENVAIGFAVMSSNTTGSQNISIGHGLSRNTTGNDNIVLGYQALDNNRSGSNNVVIGPHSAGSVAMVDNSVMIGYGSKPLGDNQTNQIVIGYGANGRGSNSVQIGNLFVTDIGGAVNWSIGSDMRLKKDIVTSPYGLDFITKLRPVNYKMKTGTTDLQSGFIAQEVEKAANSIGYEFNGIIKPKNDTDFYSLRYTEFVVPLVKAVQEQQLQIETLQKQAEIKIESLQKQLESKNAQILEIENRLLKLEQRLQ